MALGRFQGEGGFKKIVFLYERTRHLYENKERHAQNEAKTKLKTGSFLVKLRAFCARNCTNLTPNGAKTAHLGQGK